MNFGVIAWTVHNCPSPRDKIFTIAGKTIRKNFSEKKRGEFHARCNEDFFLFFFLSFSFLFFFGKGLRKSLTVKSYGLLSRDKGDVRNQDHRGAESN